MRNTKTSYIVILFALNLMVSCTKEVKNSEYSETQPINHASKYNSFADFPSDISQLDTTASIPDKTSIAYLDQLISIEKANISGSAGFGTHLEDIEKLVTKYPLGVQQAMYQYLNGLYQVKMRNNIKEGGNALLKATTYFEKNNDTTGMLYAYFYLITVNINPMDKVVGGEKNAKVYYDKIINIGERSNAPQDKLLMYHATLIFNNQVNGSKEITGSMNAFSAAQGVIEANPQFAYLTHSLNANVSRLLLNFGRFEEAQKYLEIEYAYLKKNSSNAVLPAVTTINLAYLYEQKGDSFAAEKLLSESIEVLKKANMPESNLLIECYKQLAEIRFKLRKYDTAWQTRASADSLNTLQDAANQQRAVLEVQEKYETDKKTAEIAILKAEAELLNRQKLLYAGLILLFVGLSAVIALFARRLQKTNVRLRTSQQAKSKLFSIIAHDLAAPIASYNDLATTVGYLLRTKQTEKIENLAQKIDETGSSLSLLLTNLLDWSLRQQDKIELNIQTVNLPEWVKNYVNIAAQTALYKDVKVLMPAEDKSLFLRTDPDILGIVLRNILDNAVKNAEVNSTVSVKMESKAESIQIKISNETANDASKMLTLLQKHFDSTAPLAFWQEDTGLGIQLIKEYTDMLGGVVNISLIGNEVTCAVVLPK